ncbi:hypothetical protein TNIN_309341 [Trichonephila inaurata madagascariensis]|uniref:Uncharacterized protein n=1 Tax=Trichonephila inaurata madagascariensis TaxID=2747483 RepID=A0A8X7BP83_9ARAC|nr:hypothetical protein TNIN_309341 [Trichonephila inaurata madagascariensis]
MFADWAVDVTSVDSAVDVQSVDSAVDWMSVDSADDVLPRDLHNRGKGISVAHFSDVVTKGPGYIEKCCPATEPVNLISVGIVDSVLEIAAPSSGSVVPGVEIIVPLAGVVSPEEEPASETIADTVMGRSEEALVDVVDARAPVVKIFVVENVVAAVFSVEPSSPGQIMGSLVLQPLCSF